MAGGGLKKKVGPLPAWAWGLLVLAVLAWFLFFRRSNSGTTATTGAADTATSTLYPQDNATDLNAAQAGQPSTNSAPADSLSPDVLSALQAQNSDLVTALSGAFQSSFTSGVAPYATATGYGLALPVDTPAPEQGAATVTTPTAVSQPSGSGGTKPAATQPFGGIVSKTRTKTGATLTTYANGRVVEQAQGRSPYVVKAGK